MVSLNGLGIGDAGDKDIEAASLLSFETRL